MVGVKRSARVSGDARDELGHELAESYYEGRSIRELADAYGRPYAFVRRVLVEAGVTLRPPGDPTRRLTPARQRS